MSKSVADTLSSLRFGPFQAALAALAIGGSVFLLATPHYYWALLPGPVILALLLFGRYPQFAMYLFIFLIPFEFLARLSAEQKEITVPKFLGIWLLITALLMLLTGRWQAKHLRSRLWPFLLAFVLVNFVATLNSNYPGTALAQLRFLLTAVTVFALVLLFSNRHAFAVTIPSVLIWGVLLNYAIFLLEFRFKVTMPWVSGSVFPQDVNLPAYALPTSYSVYLIFLLPFLAHRFFFSKGFTRKLIYLTFSALTVSGIVYLGSRAAFVVSLACIAILSFQYLRMLKPRFVGFFVTGALACAVVATLYIPDWYIERQKSMTDTVTNESVSMRVAFLNTGWEFFKKKPLLGYGPGTFKEEYGTTLESFKHATSYVGYKMEAHNTYLEVLIGSGVFGLLFFLVAIGLALKNFSIAAKNFLEAGDLERKLITNAYQTAFLVNLLFFLFISYLSMKHFWIFLAMSEIARRVSETSRSEEPALEEVRLRPS